MTGETDRGSFAGNHLLLGFFSTLLIVTIVAAETPIVMSAGSWNPAVQCTPVVTTIEEVIGSQTNSYGGATYDGGGFKPGIPDKRSTSPPCAYGTPSSPTFVEIHNVVLVYNTQTADCARYANGVFCDTFFNIASSGYVSPGSCPACYMHRIHVEIDQAWKSAGIAPTNPTNSTTTQIDIQGFVYWDPDHQTEAGHSFSGWEIHPLAAWRLSSQNTGSGDTSPPTWPTGSSLTTSNVSPTGLTLTWTPATDNVGVTAYRVYKGASLIATVSGTARSYNVTGLSPSTTYTFTVQAGDAGGNWSTNGPSITATTSSAPDFSIAASPLSQSMSPGGSAAYTLTIKSLNAFTGTVVLTASSSPAGLSSSTSPSSVTLSSGGTSYSTLTVTSSTIGYYTVSVTGTSGSISHSTSVTVKVTSSPDFTISSNPSNMALQQGASGTSTITLTSLNNFNGTVSLVGSVTPAGLSWTVNPTTVTVASASSASSTLTVSTTSATTTGTYTIILTGTSGSLSHSTKIVVSVTRPPNFSMVANPNKLTIQTGNSGASTLNLTSLNGFAGTVALSSTVSPTGPTASLSQANVMLSAGGTGTSTITVTAASAVSQGNYTVTVTGTSGSLTHTAKVIVTVTASNSDFKLSANPTSINIVAGTNGSSTITVSGFNGFAGTVGLTQASTPSGLSCSLNPTSVALSSSVASGSSKLSCSGTSTGNYTVTVTGTSGSLAHSATLSFTISPPPDFNVSASSTSMTIPAGSQGTSTITLTSLNGFSGNVVLTASVQPTGLVSVDPPSVTLNPTSVTLSSGGTTTSTLTISTDLLTTPETYTIIVTASDGTLSHSVSIDVTVTLLGLGLG